MRRNIGVGIGVGFGGGGNDPIPLGSTFWSAYWDADYNLTVSHGDVTAWASRVGAYSAVQGTNAPSSDVATFSGSRQSVRFDIANTECMTCNALAAIATGDDTPFTVAIHVVFPTLPAAAIMPWAFGRASTTSEFYGCRFFTGSGLGAYARGGGAAQSGTLRAAVATGTEYTFVLIRYGDTYDVALDGSRATGGACTIASVTLDTFGIGALPAGGAEYYHNDMALRRIAVAAGSGITDAQLLALHAAWSRL